MAAAVLRALAFATTLSVTAGACIAAPVDYRLGPQDRLQIRVFDWRTGTGEVHEWTALNAEFVVGASGKVALPLIGEVDANALTTAALSDTIAQRLQAKIGLSQRPDASVEVIKYRPFYILGNVERPGEFDYRPDLTVLQAVSTAGGLNRVSDSGLAAFERDAIATRGELRALAAERSALLVRQARLDAEIRGLPAIALPTAATGPAVAPDIQRTVREEQLIFDAHRDSLASQVAALGATRELLGSEVQSLASKDASLAHQLDITRKELEQISALVAKGLTVLPRQLEAEQSTAAFQSNRIDIQVATLRAQQDISKTQRDELELTTTRRADALKETTEVHARIVALDERIETARRLIYQAEVRAPETIEAAVSGERQPPIYTITRKVEGVARTLTVTEADPIQPGDTVQVEIRRDPAALAALTAAGGGRADSTN